MVGIEERKAITINFLPKEYRQLKKLAKEIRILLSMEDPLEDVIKEVLTFSRWYQEQINNNNPLYITSKLDFDKPDKNTMRRIKKIKYQKKDTAMEGKKETHTVTIEVGPESYNRLEELKRDMELDSLEDVIRETLAVVIWLRRQYKKGCRLLVAQKLHPLKVEPVRIDGLLRLR